MVGFGSGAVFGDDDLGFLKAGIFGNQLVQLVDIFLKIVNIFGVVVIGDKVER